MPEPLHPEATVGDFYPQEEIPMPHPLPFDHLLRQAALYVTQHYPGEQARIGRGLELALNQCVTVVTLGDDLDARVHSATDPEVSYRVKGTHCDCPDLAAPGLRCKHRWCTALTRMAQALHDLRDHEEPA